MNSEFSVATALLLIFSLVTTTEENNKLNSTSLALLVRWRDHREAVAAVLLGKAACVTEHGSAGDR